MKLLIVAAVFLTSSAFAQSDSHFHTRIHQKLAISGHLCEGGEMTFDEEVCQKGQWMINVDNVNYCTNDGICTQMATPPFISELERANIFIPHEGDFYDIVPVSKVSNDVTKILKKYWLHEDHGVAKVVKKKL